MLAHLKTITNANTNTLWARGDPGSRTRVIRTTAAEKCSLLLATLLCDITLYKNTVEECFATGCKGRVQKRHFCLPKKHCFGHNFNRFFSQQKRSHLTFCMKKC